jgi:hypothetical protein
MKRLLILSTCTLLLIPVLADEADARRGGGGFRGGGGYGGGAMRAGGFGGGGRAHVSLPIARPGPGNRPGGPGWAGGPGNRPGWGNRPGYGYGPGYGYRPGYAWGAAALGAGVAYSAYNSGYYGGYEQPAYSAPSDPIAECAARFKTYDPASQTYIRSKGQRVPCP